MGVGFKKKRGNNKKGIHTTEKVLIQLGTCHRLGTSYRGRKQTGKESVAVTKKGKQKKIFSFFFPKERPVGKKDTRGLRGMCR